MITRWLSNLLRDKNPIKGVSDVITFLLHRNCADETTPYPNPTPDFRIWRRFEKSDTNIIIE
jgi:hypothetical protein